MTKIDSVSQVTAQVSLTADNVSSEFPLKSKVCPSDVPPAINDSYVSKDPSKFLNRIGDPSIHDSQIFSDDPSGEPFSPSFLANSIFGENQSDSMPSQSDSLPAVSQNVLGSGEKIRNFPTMSSMFRKGPSDFVPLPSPSKNVLCSGEKIGTASHQRALGSHAIEMLSARFDEYTSTQFYRVSKLSVNYRTTCDTSTTSHQMTNELDDDYDDPPELHSQFDTLAQPPTLLRPGSADQYYKFR